MTFPRDRRESNDDYSESETVERREAALKRMLATPPKHHKPAKNKDANPPNKRGRPKKAETRIDSHDPAAGYSP